MRAEFYNKLFGVVLNKAGFSRIDDYRNSAGINGEYLVAPSAFNRSWGRNDKSQKLVHFSPKS